VSHATAKIDPASQETRKISMTPELLAQIDEMIKNAPKEQLQVNQEAGKVAGFKRR